MASVVMSGRVDPALKEKASQFGSPGEVVQQAVEEFVEKRGGLAAALRKAGLLGPEPKAASVQAAPMPSQVELAQGALKEAKANAARAAYAQSRRDRGLPSPKGLGAFLAVAEAASDEEFARLLAAHETAPHAKHAPAPPPYVKQVTALSQVARDRGFDEVANLFEAYARDMTAAGIDPMPTGDLATLHELAEELPKLHPNDLGFAVERAKALRLMAEDRRRTVEQGRALRRDRMQTTRSLAQHEAQRAETLRRVDSQHMADRIDGLEGELAEIKRVNSEILNRVIALAEKNR